jgi:hypothetical protein
MRIVSVTAPALPFATSNEDAGDSEPDVVVNDEACPVASGKAPVGANVAGTTIDSPVASVANDDGRSAVSDE